MGIAEHILDRKTVRTATDAGRITTGRARSSLVLQQGIGLHRSFLHSVIPEIHAIPHDRGDCDSGSARPLALTAACPAVFAAV